MPEIKLNRLVMHYEVYGSGHPILFLHGFPLDFHCMSGSFEPLFFPPSKWQRIYVDLPGMGSTKKADWIQSTDDILACVLDFIDKMLGSTPFAVVGYSYGGYLARGVVYHYAKQVSGVGLLAPMVIADHTQRHLPPHQVLIKNPVTLSEIDPILRRDFEDIAVIQTKPVWDRYRREIVSGMQAADNTFLTRLQEHAYGFVENYDEKMRPCDKPTFILVGRQDSIVGYQDAWGLLEKFPRASYVIVDKAGHILPLEQGALFNEVVMDWLRRVESELEAPRAV